MDKISFKGYQNILRLPIVKGENGAERIKGMRIVSQITNDFTRDLDEWKPFLEKFPDRNNEAFLTLDCIENSGPLGIKLNGVPLVNTPNNIPLFQMLFKFTERISSSHQKIDTKTFKLTQDFNKSLKRLSDTELIDIDDLSKEEIDMIRDKSTIKEVASRLSNEVLDRLWILNQDQKIVWVG